MYRLHVKHSAFTLALLALAGCAPTRPSLIAADHGALSRVSSIYLGDFGRGEGSSLVREKIRLRLLASKRFAVLETPDGADASLVGSAGVRSYVAGESTELAEFGVLRLVDNRSQQTIWAHEYKRPSVVWRVGDVSDRVADQMVERLLADSR